jgi:hypothetical protein
MRERNCITCNKRVICDCLLCHYFDEIDEKEEVDSTSNKIFYHYPICLQSNEPARFELPEYVTFCSDGCVKRYPK